MLNRKLEEKNAKNTTKNVMYTIAIVYLTYCQSQLIINSVIPCFGSSQ